MLRLNLILIALLLTANCQAESRFLSSVRITGIEAFDEDNLSSATISLDVVGGLCQAGTAEEQPEPFFDTLIKFKIKNGTKTFVRITGYEVEVKNIASKRKVKTPRLSIIGDIAPDQTAELSALFLRVLNNTKTFHGSNNAIAGDTGARNVTFKVYGRDSKGRAVRLSATTVFVFRNIDRCQ